MNAPTLAPELGLIQETETPDNSILFEDIATLEEEYLTFSRQAREARAELNRKLAEAKSCGLSPTVDWTARLIELDLRKPEITDYYEQLEKTLSEVAKTVPVNGYFKASDGTVFKIVEPTGTFVSFKRLGYERTKRDGEARGSLSVKEAKDAEANGFKPLPVEE